ncbi:DNA glycosylase [Peniophora sp. CONT]|nr:DNA glycosylase [Peniophora sp. CONT]
MESSSPKKPKPVPRSLATPHPAPERWREVYDAIKVMRAGRTAAVDTMGCDQAQTAETDPKNKRLTTLISLMLSSQTKDEVTDAAVKSLRTALGGSLSLTALLNADADTISNAINKVGFWRRKTDYIMRSAVILRDRFDSDVPKDIDDLCSLPGVGPKMGFLCLQAAWNINSGIGVDVHVDRITNRLGWHNPPTLGHPEKTRQRMIRLNLESWLPTELHHEINHLLVGFGQEICLPLRPRCDECSLSKTGLCPSAETVTKAKTRKTKTVKTPSAKVEIEYEETSTLNEPPA